MILVIQGKIAVQINLAAPFVISPVTLHASLITASAAELRNYFNRTCLINATRNIQIYRNLRKDEKTIY